MLVFGGEKNTSSNTLTTMMYYADGSSFDPASNTWTAISTTSAPSARSRHSAEYACHEGNYGLENILRAARVQEAAAR
jgi:hypothetical protein